MTDNFTDLNKDFGANSWLVEDLYEQFLADPQSVSENWRQYFSTVKHDDRAVDNVLKAQATVDTLNTGEISVPDPIQIAEELGATPDQRHTFNMADVTRSDLPPAPTSKIKQPTSPYVARLNSAKETNKVSQAKDNLVQLKGVAAAISRNMDQSLSVPTATSVRQIPAKVMIENREIINRHLAHISSKKVSFTHIIGFAVIESLADMPSMNVRYEEKDSKPYIHYLPDVNFGVAIDLPQSDGSRQLVVPVVHKADKSNFAQWLDAFFEIVSKARDNKLQASDYAGTTVTLTNPGMLGTVHSIPRLMKNQGLIIGIGAMNYPAQYAGTNQSNLASMGIGKVFTLTSTYDHRVIQGAASGEFLALVEKKLLGLDGFYNRIFACLQIPYEPVQWQTDIDYSELEEEDKPARVTQLIHAFRSRGHLVADIDPLSYRLRVHPDLDFKNYGLTLWDLDRQFPTSDFTDHKRLPLRDILAYLRNTYTRSIGFEYMHIQDPVQRKWIQEYIERPTAKPSEQEQKYILKILNRAEAFEEFLQTKYIGQKRFSLEGGESLIPLLDSILNMGAKNNVEETVIGMPHRGRLNVLANIAGKSYAQIFSEFEGNYAPNSAKGSGDVKYHLGATGEYQSYDGHKSKVYLAANPSHLEAVDGVVEGISRAKQDRIDSENPENSIVPILIHGDSAFAGQGVVYETLNMSQLQAYKTGGTIHIIVNNQIGFTTGPASARSTNYCTDLAKGLQVPIFHINADDVEAVTYVGRLALLYRQVFNKDVIIDLNCYRKRGHNEGDDPSMTQPVMYSFISKKPSTREVYAKMLIDRGDITVEEYEQYMSEYNSLLEKIFAEIKNKSEEDSSCSSSEAKSASATVNSAISESVFKRICQAHINIPEDMTLHPKITKLYESRANAYEHGNIDWGLGEILAFGSLLIEGRSVRISGQDARRATFVQRQAVAHDLNNGKEWTPLHSLTDTQGRFDIYDSSLSEYAPLAFEYGYSVQNKDALTIWEAQFGDFANGAQTVVDEFISSSEQKWGQTSPLVMLLPHGYEGQGPDHSCARVERYLQLCAQDNMVVCQPSTPANYFHLLRSHTNSGRQKPLIVFTPKQLLRLRAAQSAPADFTSGSFQKIIDEVDGNIVAQAHSVSKVILCTGRLYYDLLQERNKLGRSDVALVRLEQLYPLTAKEISDVVDKYTNAKLVFAQDEPANYGPYAHLATRVFPQLSKAVSLVSRPEAASPAAGTAQLHKKENAQLLQDAFA